MSELGKKVDNAIKLLRTAEEEAKRRPTNRGGQLTDYVEIAYSGGKDSDVILHLAKMAGIKYNPIHHVTTVDPSFTIAHARSVGAEVLFPEKSFLQLIQYRGFPKRIRRFCCKELKEKKVCNVAVHGIRKSESRARNKRYSEPQICRYYGGRQDQNVEVFLPILEWTDKDVAEFIRVHNIQCHPLYYDDCGSFHVERRCGCQCCPLKSRKQQLQDFKDKPKWVRAWIKNGIIWWNKPHTERWSSGEKFGNIYNLFFNNIFCDTYYDFQQKTTGLFGKMDCKAFLEDYFKIDLP